jgi:dienelactone hydrolase
MSSRLGLKRFTLAVLFSVCLCEYPVRALAADFMEEPGFFRVRIEGRQVRLQGTTVKRADATEKLPIALITHGKPPDQAGALDLKPEKYVGVARDLARRGWFAAVVLRRGFGQSDGPLPMPVTCASTSLIERFSADADDLQAALEAIAHRSDVDGTRAIAVGVSAGGAAVLALGARNPSNLKAVINVSGGLRFAGCPKEEALVDAVKKLGTTSRVPTLWLYAKNDSYFAPDLVDRMRDSFLDGGGDARLVMYESFGTDGHKLFQDGRHQWMMELDSFLRFGKLPTWQPRDVEALLEKLSSKNRDFVEKYLAAPSQRAVARSTTSSHLYMSWGFATIQLARARALEGCQKQRPDELCVLVMEDDRWIGNEVTEQSAVAGSAATAKSGP